MEPENIAEDIINDLTGRKGFDTTWDSLDPDTKDIIRAKWSKKIKEAEETNTSTEAFLNQKYDHVLKYKISDLKTDQLTTLHDTNLQQRMCVNRNLHNGQTKHITVQVKIQDNGNLYIAGDYTK